MVSYEHLVGQAVRAPVRGWDFTRQRGRTSGGTPSWSYAERASALLAPARRLLDMDTGGGEFLASLAPLPERTVALEGWPPNLTVAARRLGPMGVAVLGGAAERIPAGKHAFDLVLNRHGGLDGAEVARVLAPGGRLLTQQVGSRNDQELNDALDAPPAAGEREWTLDVAADSLRRAGLRVLDAREEMVGHVFHDIGAVVFHLRAVPWQIRDFDHERYAGPLRALHERIRSDGGFAVRNHRFLIEAGQE
ncbi:class I SAM-dependent methyltransferase [Nonomuraea sp. SBT364]|uniref:class I SAM-dependent methyltransferase n=1 Tax=Nonomuraea sp. SBT364 TaxID=1580530 RepID=UPI00069FB3B1|nr:methyltransferase domain-containing protein [Nonomuraea sp. SBT364]